MSPMNTKSLLSQHMLSRASLSKCVIDADILYEKPKNFLSKTKPILDQKLLEHELASILFAKSN